MCSPYVTPTSERVSLPPEGSLAAAVKTSPANNLSLTTCTEPTKDSGQTGESARITTTATTSFCSLHQDQQASLFLPALSVSVTTTPLVTATTSVTALWSVAKVKQYLADRSCQVLQEIIRDNAHRRQKSYQDPAQLEAGIYYPNDYYALLKRVNAHKHEELREAGSYFHGKAPEEFYAMRLNGFTLTGYEPCYFVLKEGKSASEALDAMRHGLALMGCGEVCFLSLYITLRDLLGQDKFDRLFSAQSNTPLILHAFHPNTAMGCFLSCSFEDTPEKGDAVVFQNCPLYYQKHPNGEDASLWTLCDGKNNHKLSYIGLGLPSRSSQAEVLKFLLRGFNQRPVSLDILPRRHQYRFARPTGCESFRMDVNDPMKHGARRFMIGKLRYDRIVQLVNSPIEDARALLDGWWAEHCASLRYKEWC